jgi:hypothetical protein
MSLVTWIKKSKIALKRRRLIKLGWETEYGLDVEQSAAYPKTSDVDPGIHCGRSRTKLEQRSDF